MQVETMVSTYTRAYKTFIFRENKQWNNLTMRVIAAYIAAPAIF